MSTIPPPPPTDPHIHDDEDAAFVVIQAGEAELAVSRAFDALVRAVMHAEATAMACARALDQTAPGTPR